MVVEQFSTRISALEALASDVGQVNRNSLAERAANWLACPSSVPATQSRIAGAGSGHSGRDTKPRRTRRTCSRQSDQRWTCTRDSDQCGRTEDMAGCASDELDPSTMSAYVRAGNQMFTQ
jgi:hypothetical protein